MLRTARRRPLVLGCLAAATLLCLYYYSTLVTAATDPAPLTASTSSTSSSTMAAAEHEACEVMVEHPGDIDTVEVFQQLDMAPPWMERREYWSSEMEDRFQRRKPLWNRLPLRVIVMPHSHTDPGWLKTMEGYFATSTKNIINNMVNKLTEHRNMTFILTEMSFLHMWWEGAPPELRGKLRALLAEGRLEVPTGGWVMTDEANVELFSMVDQLVEGHAFLRQELGVKPTASWSVDSFGHGGTFPHLLARSGIDNMVIMRVHFAWKEHLARHQAGEFLFKQPWEADGRQAPLCHNFPYDIYSIKHSCGPHPQTCLGFDFRHVEGEYTEFSAAYSPIDQGNLQVRAELLLEQYGRTGSLLPHNVVLVPLGDDFRYNLPDEFDQQYKNYMMLMEFINSRPEYHAKVTFGTLSDYFREVRARQTKFATLTGDFFVYSDIFSEGQPAYWSGYFSTRPHLKLLSRQLAARLRGAEILYTLATETARRGGESALPLAVLSSQYDSLVEARRHLGLFQHHDAITGTSKAFVMQDYEGKLAAGLDTAQRLTEVAAQFLLQRDQASLDLSRPLRHLLWRGEGREHLSTLDLHTAAAHTLVLYNSLAEEREEVVSLRTNSASVCVRDEEGNLIDAMVAPHFNSSAPQLDFGLFDVWFRATLPPLALTTYTVTFCDRTGSEFAQSRTKVYCMRCPDTTSPGPYTLHTLPAGTVKLENHVYTLLFDPVTRLLTSVTNKLSGRSLPVHLEFASYPSAAFRSGAYLFSVDRSAAAETGPPFGEREVADLVIVSGPVFAQVTVVWRVLGEGGVSTLAHTVRLQHTAGPQGEAIQLESLVDFGPPPNMRDTELVLRLRSGLATGRRFYTDKSGLGFIRREWREAAGLEGSMYPVTSAAFLQGNNTRVSLLVTHAMGAASVEEGSMEVMLDRRTTYDDARGMGEGVLDSRATMHRMWLLVEPRDPAAPTGPALPALSPLATVLGRQQEHPVTALHATSPNTLGLRPSLGLLTSPLPCDCHLLNLRSWSPRRPGPRALLTLHRQAPDCAWASLSLQDCQRPSSSPSLHFPSHATTLQPVSLTGNHPLERQGDPLTLQPIELVAFNITFN